MPLFVLQGPTGAIRTAIMTKTAKLDLYNDALQRILQPYLLRTSCSVELRSCVCNYFTILTTDSKLVTLIVEIFPRNTYVKRRKNGALLNDAELNMWKCYCRRVVAVARLIPSDAREVS